MPQTGDLKAQKIGDVERELEGIAKSNEELREALAQLRSRLSLVLREEKEAKAEGEDMPQLVPLADKIRNEKLTIQSHIGFVNNLTGRLEL